MSAEDTSAPSEKAAVTGIRCAVVRRHRTPGGKECQLMSPTQ